MILHDFQCGECGVSFEALVNSGAQTEECHTCGKEAQRAMSAPKIRSVINDPSRTSEALKRRSHAHSVAEAKANPERLSRMVGGRPAAQGRWNIRTPKKS